MPVVRHRNLPIKAPMIFALSGLAGCATSIDMNDDKTGGLARVGAFASAEKAQSKVRLACGIDQTSPFEPITLNIGLPAITHVVHPFSCTESEKDTQ